MERRIWHSKSVNSSCLTVHIPRSDDVPISAIKAGSRNILGSLYQKHGMSAYFQSSFGKSRRAFTPGFLVGIGLTNLNHFL